MANYYFYPYIALTGGADGALDSLDGALLKDGDAAYVVVPSTRKTYVYTLDADSAETESSPSIIAPDNNAGDKRWKLTNYTVNENDVKFYGATGDGTTDDRSALFDADAGATGYVDYTPGTYLIESDLTLSTPIVMNLGAKFSIATGVTLTLNCTMQAGLYQVFSWAGTGKVVFGDGNIPEVRPEWWGAVADNDTDCTSAFAAAITAAIANRSVMRTQTLILADGVYEVTATSGNYAVTASCPIRGLGPNNSVIKNVGAGSAMKVDAAYYSRFENFSVFGTSSGEDGIVIGPVYAVPPSYSQFTNVDSVWHGRDGLVINHGWGTRFTSCNFSSNGGLGVHLKPDGDHPGTKNAHVFRDCNARWNGGVTDNTGVYTKGGVLITNSNGVFWHGGIVESNNAWGFIIGTDTAANSLISIQNCYMESNPPSASEAAVDVATTIGGSIYAASKYERVEVSGCYIAYGGISADQTGYAFFVAASPENSSYFKEWGNHVVSNGGAGSIQRDSGLFLDWTHSYVSNSLVPGTYDVYYIDEASNVSISGVIHMQAKIGTAACGVYPFVGGYNTSGGSYIDVGACIAGLGATTPPTMDYDGTDKVFQLTIAADEVAHVELRINGKQANGAHSFSMIASSGVWNDDFAKRAN